jgi:hypothetical protein
MTSFSVGNRETYERIFERDPSPRPSAYPGTVNDRRST